MNASESTRKKNPEAESRPAARVSHAVHGNHGTNGTDGTHGTYGKDGTHAAGFSHGDSCSPLATPSPGPEAWPDLRLFLSHPATLLVFRLVVGGVLVLAASLKARSIPAFALSIGGFQIVPESWLVRLAYFFVWQEFIAGGCLVLGIFSRSAALVCGGLLTAFLGALGWAVFQGLPIDCGCFGDLFGEQVGFGMLARNLFLIGLALCLAAKGGGTLAVERLWTRRRPGAMEP